MRMFDDLSTLSTIFLLLGLFFSIVAILNAWRRKRQTAAPPIRAGPILMSDPHSGTPVSTRPPLSESAPLQTMPPPAPTPEIKLLDDTGATAPADAKAGPVKGSQYFRQLDARGVEMNATRGGKHDDYQWE